MFSQVSLFPPRFSQILAILPEEACWLPSVAVQRLATGGTLTNGEVLDLRNRIARTHKYCNKKLLGLLKLIDLTNLEDYKKATPKSIGGKVNKIKEGVLSCEWTFRQFKGKEAAADASPMTNDEPAAGGSMDDDMGQSGANLSLVKKLEAVVAEAAAEKTEAKANYKQHQLDFAVARTSMRGLESELVHQKLQLKKVNLPLSPSLLCPLSLLLCLGGGGCVASYVVVVV